MLISDWSSDVCSSDLEAVLASLGEALVDSAQRKWTAGASAGDARPVRNPADQRDIVGHVTEVSEAAANDAMGRAQAAFEAWSAVPVRLEERRVGNEWVRTWRSGWYQCQ